MSAPAASLADALDAFSRTASDAGIPISSPIPDGKIHRIRVEGDGHGEKSGWYVVFTDGLPAGSFGDWRSGIKQKWCAKDHSQLTPEERGAFARQMEEARTQRKIEEDAKNQEARQAVDFILRDAFPAPAEHPYIQAKKIQSHGLKVDSENRLIVPLCDAHGILWTLERIGPDGTKRFLHGGRKRGCFFPLGSAAEVERHGTIIFVEGFATGASIREATGLPVVAAMDAENLRPVAESLRTKYPKTKFVFASDHDESGRGQDAAEEAAQAVNGIVVVCPEVGEDFNDLALAQGEEAVKAVLAPALAPPPVDLHDTNGHHPAPPDGEKPEDGGDPPEEPTPPSFSEEHLALRFTREHAGLWRYCAAWGTWLNWTGGRWQRDSTLRAFELSRIICRRAAAEAEPFSASSAKGIASSKTVAGVERLARADRQIAISPDVFDSNPWALNTPGGIVNLKTGETRPAAPTNYHTKITSCAPGGECPRWMSLLKLITKADEGYEAFLQRMCGYQLTGLTIEHAIFFLWGTGRNAKSTFVETLGSILGDYRVTALSETFLASKTDRHPTELAALRGARLVTATETQAGRAWDEAKLKATSGGDEITARVMRGDPFSFRPAFKLVISGNHKPTLRNVDEAIKRRLFLIPFSTTIRPEDEIKGFAEKLVPEHGGILRWMISGCLAWQAQGLNPPSVVRDASDSYFEGEDVLGEWLSEETESGPYRTEAKALFTSWRRWANDRNLFVGSQKAFGQKLEDRGFKRQRTTTGAKGYYGLRDKVHEASTGEAERDF